MVKFLQKLIRLSFHNSICTNSDPVAIVNDINIVSWIKTLWAGTNLRKLRKFLPAKLSSYMVYSDETDQAFIQVCMYLIKIYQMWQSRVEIEGYSVAYFDHMAAFEAPYC